MDCCFLPWCLEGEPVQAAAARLNAELPPGHQQAL